MDGDVCDELAAHFVQEVVPAPQPHGDLPVPPARQHQGALRVRHHTADVGLN